MRRRSSAEPRVGPARTRVAVPAGVACIAVAAATLPSVAGTSAGDASRKSADDARPAAFTAPDVSRIRNVSVENVAGFVAVRVRHRGGYWDGRTDIAIGRDGGNRPYRAHVSKGDGELELDRSGDEWKCSGARANAPDASDETLVVIPLSCFNGSMPRCPVRAAPTVTCSGGLSAVTDPATTSVLCS